MTNAELERIRQRYRGGHFTSLWSDAQAVKQAVAHSVSILEKALDRCQDEDMRGGETEEALCFLAEQGPSNWVEQFRRALDMSSPDGRWQNANAALNGIKKRLPG